MKTTIQIKTDTRDKLLSLRLHEFEPYNNIIKRLIDEHEQSNPLKKLTGEE